MKLILTKASLLGASLALIAGFAAPALASATIVQNHDNDDCKQQNSYNSRSFQNNNNDDKCKCEKNDSYKKSYEKDEKKCEPKCDTVKLTTITHFNKDHNEGDVECVDVCKNISGDQATVPTGKVLDKDGNCVDPTPPVVTTSTTTTTPAPQVVVPTGSVKAGAGGTASNPIVQLIGVATSFGALAVGFVVRKFAL